MDRLKTNSIIQSGNGRPCSPRAKSVKAGVSQVTSLIRERRIVALAYRRSQSELDRAHLEQIDRDLIEYNIDIPAIQQSVVARRRT